MYNEQHLKNIFIQGDLKKAMDYIERYHEDPSAIEKYQALFKRKEFIQLSEDPAMDNLLMPYQLYFHDVFYDDVETKVAEERLRERLSTLLGSKNLPMEELEEQLKVIIEAQDYYFLGGKSNGYYGPYVWKSKEVVTYSVELPDTTEDFDIFILDGFITRSWMDYISFGLAGTGGWAQANGAICCIRNRYDFESEAFKVSLLKHEAQHSLDLRKYEGITNAELEYRAKLVELIYSNDLSILGNFYERAKSTQINEGHVQASVQIKDAFNQRFFEEEIDDIDGVYDLNGIQVFARQLFQESNEVLDFK